MGSKICIRFFWPSPVIEPMIFLGEQVPYGLPLHEPSSRERTSMASHRPFTNPNNPPLILNIPPEPMFLLGDETTYLAPFLVAIQPRQ